MNNLKYNAFFCTDIYVKKEFENLRFINDMLILTTYMLCFIASYLTIIIFIIIFVKMQHYN